MCVTRSIITCVFLCIYASQLKSSGHYHHTRRSPGRQMTRKKAELTANHPPHSQLLHMMKTQLHNPTNVRTKQLCNYQTVPLYKPRHTLCDLFTPVSTPTANPTHCQSHSTGVNCIVTYTDHVWCFAIAQSFTYTDHVCCLVLCYCTIVRGSQTQRQHRSGMGSETQTKIQHVGGMVVDLGMAAPLCSHGLQLHAHGPIMKQIMYLLILFRQC